MHIKRTATWLAIPAAFALLVTGCGGGGNSGGGGSGGSAGVDQSQGSVTIYGTEPQNPLTPGNTDEQGGSRAVDEIYVGLVGYDAKTAKPYNVMADSITPSSDASSYDIKIKPGWKFHDGTPVTAKNYVDAWNYVAYAPNAQQNADFLSDIKGYSDVHPDDQNAKPTTDKMSGLQVVSDTEFKVQLKGPNSVFPVKVGYEAFYPMPDAFFKDPKGFEQHPIGNGPMKFVSRTPNQDINLTRFDEYQGPDKVHFKDLDIKIYSDLNAAYNDVVANNLDFIDLLPPQALVGDKYKTDLGDRVSQADLIDIDTIALPSYVPGYNNPDLRKAISLAVDRASITSKVLNNKYSPADSFFSKSLDGNVPGSCTYCKFDPDQAKQLFQKSGFTGKLTISSNSDGGHKEAMTAVCNSIHNVLGVECDFVPAASFGQYRSMVTSHQATGMLRSDWSADYPSVEDFLNPIYKTGASSNDSVYSNPQVDALLKQADATADSAAAIKLYQQAEQLVAQDMPNVPLWSENGLAGHSSKLVQANQSFKRTPDIASFRLAS